MPWGLQKPLAYRRSTLCVAWSPGLGVWDVAPAPAQTSNGEKPRTVAPRKLPTSVPSRLPLAESPSAERLSRRPAAELLRNGGGRGGRGKAEVTVLPVEGASEGWVYIGGCNGVPAARPENTDGGPV